MPHTSTVECYYQKQTSFVASLSSYRSALVLNNMAITLLQQGCFKPAMKTLNDALSILNLVFAAAAAQHQSNHAEVRAIQEMMDEKYQRAMQRSNEALPKKNINNKTATVLLIDIVPVDEDDLGALKSAVVYGSSTAVVFPIRFRYIPSEGYASTDITCQFGVLLYNYGLVQFLTATRRHHQDKKTAASQSHKKNRLIAHPRVNERLLSRALKSLQIAEKSSLPQLDGSHNNSCDFSAEQQQQHQQDDLPRLLFSSLILNCMVSVYQAMALPGKARQAQAAAFDLNCLLEQDEYYIHLMVQTKTTAAAA